MFWVCVDDAGACLIIRAVLCRLLWLRLVCGCVHSFLICTSDVGQPQAQGAGLVPGVVGKLCCSLLEQLLHMGVSTGSAPQDCAVAGASHSKHS